MVAREYSERITVYVTRNEKQRMVNLAKSEGRSVTSQARLMLLKQLEKG